MKFNLDDSITSKGSMTGDLLNTSVGQKVTGAEDSCCPSLTIKQRVIGYGICTGLGKFSPVYKFRLYHKYAQLRCYFLSCKRRHSQICSSLLSGYYPKFSRVCSWFLKYYRSLFLSGPLKQLKAMFHKKRIISTIVMLVALALTLVFAILVQNAILTMICAVV